MAGVVTMTSLWAPYPSPKLWRPSWNWAVLEDDKPHPRTRLFVCLWQARISFLWKKKCDGNEPQEWLPCGDLADVNIGVEGLGLPGVLGIVSFPARAQAFFEEERKLLGCVVVAFRHFLRLRALIKEGFVCV